MVAIWVFLCAFLSCTGWVLSGLHSLNRAGYLVAFGLGLVGMLAARQRLGWQTGWQLNARKLWRRFTRPLPLAFLLLAGLAILGGALHAPSNYDGLTYRTPRVLHWLAAEQWHWVQTSFPRLNVRAAGYEWVTAPLIAFFQTDRLNFMISGISLLLLPGLSFSILRRLGVRSRVAWCWMWLLPTGYTYLLQAGSIGNDLFGAVFGFAAIDFALRARVSGRVECLWLSLLAAALATGAKSINLPLGLPWLMALGPALKLVWRKPVGTLLVAVVAVMASLVPISWLNIRYCGDWGGQVLEHSAFGGQPFLRLAANTIGFTLQNFTPPVFPFAKAANHFLAEARPAWLAARMDAAFEPGAAKFQLVELQTEEFAGLGFGLCCLLLGSVIALRRARRRPTAPSLAERHHLLVGAAGWVAVLVFMAQSGLTGAVRYLAPYNVLLLAPLLALAGQERVVRAVWWQRGCGLVFTLAALLLVLNPGRPLWPAVTVLRHLGAENSSHHLVRRAWTVYSVYSRRADAFAPARAVLPPDTRLLGFVSFDDPETSLWRPFGTRRILHVQRTETAADLRRRGLKYVLVSSEILQNYWEMSLETWLAQVDGERLATVALDLRASAGPKDWHLVRLR